MKALIFIILTIVGTKISHENLTAVPKNLTIRTEGKPIYKKHPSLNIMLLEYFADSLRIFADGKLIKKGFFKTNESTTIADQLIFTSKDLKSLKKVVIQVISNRKIKDKIVFSIRKGYEYIRIDKDGSKWSLIYSNRLIMYE